MRRQLYRGGGITSIPRQGYGIGDFVRKLIPNEIADVASKAAPFVAPFNPIAAGLMRGIGRYDKRGSLSDALKQGIATYGLGQGARYLGGAGMQTGFDPRGGMGGGMFRSPIGTETGFKMGAWGGADRAPLVDAADAGTNWKTATTEGPQSKFNKFLFGEKGGTGFFGDKGLIGAKGKFDMKGAFGKGIPAVMAGSTIASLAVQAAMGDVGERKPGESLEAFNARRRSTVGSYLNEYFRKANKFRIAPEDMDKAAADFVAQNTKEYVASGQFNQGGRVGLAFGTPEAGIKSLEAGAPEITYEGDMTPMEDTQTASAEDPLLVEEYQKYVFDMEEQGLQPISFEQFKAEARSGVAQGGRIGYSEGSWEAEWDMLYNDYKAKQIELGKEFVSKEEFIDMHRDNNAQGGRIGLRRGTEVYGWWDPRNLPSKEQEEKWARERLEREKKAKEDYVEDEVFTVKDIFERDTPLLEDTFGLSEGFTLSPLTLFRRYLARKELERKGDTADKGYTYKKAQGGRIKQLYGTGPNGLPGIPRQASDGMEFDMRENGGFQGLGAKEKKDDVKALLAKNEFVFTADAVRGAGGGDIELGAQRMYDTMKNLEKRVV